MSLQEICQQLLIAAAGITAMESPGDCPELRIMEPSLLSVEVCGRPGCAAHAYFDRENHIILLSGGLDFEFAYPRSVLLHELVHYLQDANEQWETGCTAALSRELQAFRSQESYLLDKGYRVPVSRNIRFYSCAEDDEAPAG